MNSVNQSISILSFPAESSPIDRFIENLPPYLAAFFGESLLFCDPTYGVVFQRRQVCDNHHDGLHRVRPTDVRVPLQQGDALWEAIDEKREAKVEERF